MESYQNQSGAQQTHPQLDQYGNPVPIGTGAYGGAPVMAGHHTEGGGGLSGMLHRSGSSSSSSSSSVRYTCFSFILDLDTVYFLYN